MNGEELIEKKVARNLYELVHSFHVTLLANKIIIHFQVKTVRYNFLNEVSILLKIFVLTVLKKKRRAICAREKGTIVN